MEVRTVGELCRSLLSPLLVLHLFGQLPTASSIGCYVCNSQNGSDSTCHDPYNSSVYEDSCRAGKHERNGLFPASFCFKIKGTADRNGESMYVRGCTTYDMGNMCGLYDFENREYKGCIKTCTTNGCNSAPPISLKRSLFSLLLTSSLPPLLLISLTNQMGTE